MQLLPGSSHAEYTVRVPRNGHRALPERPAPRGTLPRSGAAETPLQQLAEQVDAGMVGINRGLSPLRVRPDRRAARVGAGAGLQRATHSATSTRSKLASTPRTRFGLPAPSGPDHRREGEVVLVGQRATAMVICGWGRPERAGTSTAAAEVGYRSQAGSGTPPGSPPGSSGVASIGGGGSGSGASGSSSAGSSGTGSSGLMTGSGSGSGSLMPRVNQQSRWPARCETAAIMPQPCIGRTGPNSSANSSP